MGRKLLLAAVIVTAAALASQAAVLPGSLPGRLPPQPRDGEGGETVDVPILIYHAVRPYIASDTPAVRRYIATPQTLEKELAWLQGNGYASVSFDDLAARLTRGAPLPDRPVIISFDDDWENQYTVALPLLKKYGFTATFFVWVATVGTPHHMSWDEVRALRAAGMQVGSHTQTHTRLTRVRSPAALARELAGARRIIEGRVGLPVTCLAYPFGQYDARVAAAAREAGFTTARTTWPGVRHSAAGLFSLAGLIRTESARSLVEALRKDLEEGAAGEQEAEKDLLR